jgi:hypothetical protein
MDMDDGGMSMPMMSMTFSSWSTYKLQIIFSSWDVKTQGQFALSCFAVILAPIVYFALKHYIYILEDKMGGFKKVRVTTSDYTKLHEQNAALEVTARELEEGNGGGKNWVNAANLNMTMFQMKVLHAFLSALNYGMALMLMLVSMTYNPTLFVMLLIGYGIGDFFFFTRSSRFDTITDCH